MHLVLVACGKNKQPSPCEARDLYTGGLFQKSRAWAEKHGDAWAILSAKHFLLSPPAPVSPYDETLNNASTKQIEHWSKCVIRLLCATYPTAKTVTFLAGEKYRRHLEGYLKNCCIQTKTPMAGLGIGQQLAWLKENT